MTYTLSHNKGNVNDLNRMPHLTRIARRWELTS